MHKVISSLETISVGIFSNVVQLRKEKKARTLLALRDNFPLSFVLGLIDVLGHELMIAWAETQGAEDRAQAIMT